MGVPVPLPRQLKAPASRYPARFLGSVYREGPLSPQVLSSTALETFPGQLLEERNMNLPLPKAPLLWLESAGTPALVAELAEPEPLTLKEGS